MFKCTISTQGILALQEGNILKLLPKKSKQINLTVCECFQDLAQLLQNAFNIVGIKEVYLSKFN